MKFFIVFNIWRCNHVPNIIEWAICHFFLQKRIPPVKLYNSKHYIYHTQIKQPRLEFFQKKVAQKFESYIKEP